MKTPLGKGIFLVASPSLRDPNFQQAVILLCEHGPDGALGVVVNRPTQITITEVLPQVPILEGQDHKVFAGGPVQQNNLLILYRTPEGQTDSHHVFDGVYLGGNLSDLEDLLRDPSSLSNMRAFIGYSGWAPGQLENEMRTGSWLTQPADSAAMFETDHRRLWGNILQSFGQDLPLSADMPVVLYTDMPVDPSLN